MRWLVKRATLLGVAALLLGCGPATSSHPTVTVPSDVDPVYGHLTHAQPKLPTVTLRIGMLLGGTPLTAEVASQLVQIATGMMYRTNLAENEGMLFVFPNAAPRSFYMRNCTVPLSAAYIEPDGTIAEIVDLQPGNETPVASKSANIQFVLEVPQGWFQRHNLKPGEVVRTERGSLQETFFRR